MKLHNQRVLAVRCGVVERVEEVSAMWAEMRAALQQAKGRVVATADFRIGALYRQEISDGLLGILKNDSPMVERSAHLIGPSALLGLQIERIVRESNHPSRRVFRSVDDALRYLGEVLTSSEVSWLREWYGTLPAAAKG